MAAALLLVVTLSHLFRRDTWLPSLLLQIPTTRGLLYDAFYDAHSRKWIEWSAIVPEYAPPVPFEFSRILVPTTDSVLYTWMLSRLVGTEKPVLFVGESGTAKTVTIQNFLSKELQPEKFNVLNINFSSRTTSRDVQVCGVNTARPPSAAQRRTRLQLIRCFTRVPVLQTNIEVNVDKRSGKIYGPPVGKKLMIFIDDVNMVSRRDCERAELLTFLQPAAHRRLSPLRLLSVARAAQEGQVRHAAADRAAALPRGPGVHVRPWQGPRPAPLQGPAVRR